MTTLHMHGRVAEDLIRERRARGVDTYDEMWDGVYHVTPAGTGEHGALQAGLVALLRAAGMPGTAATGPVNIGHERNYRVPDVALVPRDRLRQVWFAQALLVGEIYSPDDETYEKFDHYRDHGVAEVLVVRPDEERVEVWSLAPGRPAGRADTSSVLGLSAEEIWLAIQ